MQQKVHQFQLNHPTKKQVTKNSTTGQDTMETNDNNDDDVFSSNGQQKNDNDSKTDTTATTTAATTTTTSQTSLAGRKRSKSSSLTVNIENISNTETAAHGGHDTTSDDARSHDSCKHHTSLLLQLSCIIQLMSVQCPTAFIHISLTSKGSSRDNIPKPSTPLDKLPMKLNEMPLPKKGMDGVLKKV